MRDVELPAVRVATTVHRGAYDGLGDAHAAVRAWCVAHERVVTGMRWAVYGDWREDARELETEISWVVQ